MLVSHVLVKLRIARVTRTPLSFPLLTQVSRVELVDEVMMHAFNLANSYSYTEQPTLMFELVGASKVPQLGARLVEMIHATEQCFINHRSIRCSRLHPSWYALCMFLGSLTMAGVGVVCAPHPSRAIYRAS